MPIYDVKIATTAEAMKDRKTITIQDIQKVMIDLRERNGNGGILSLLDRDDHILLRLAIDKKQFEQRSLF